MKKLLFILICMMCTAVVQAKHIIGGQVYYKFVSNNGNSYTYKVSMKLYRICESGPQIAEMPSTVVLVAFDKSNNQSVGSFTVTRSDFQIKNLTQFDPCIVNPPKVCFQVGLFETNITVPINDAGYIVAFQSCCRDNSMSNIVAEPIPGQPNNLGTGATYFTELPGRSNGILGNSSPIFNKEEATLVCADKKFTYDFSATDPDSDSLSYEFCDAYKGGSTTDQSGIPLPAVSPPYDFVSYISPFSGQQPLGSTVTIDPKTGIISGIAPGAGKYVVTVCVHEFRNGKQIGTLRKDFHVNVTTCVKQVTASMPEKYADCDGYTINFVNNSTRGKPYFWDFGDGTTFSTTDPATLPHTYARNGKYTVKLYVDKDSNCGDSATATVYVYPRFLPDFSEVGLCSQKVTHFTDRSRVDVGQIEYYKWNFGTGNAGDTSNLRNPDFQYPGPGTYSVVLYARSNQGCERFDTATLTIYDKPPFTATADTLLCAKDSLHLWATSDLPGNYAWTPGNYNIINPNTPNPIAFPRKDTTYTVTFTDRDQCTNSKTVFVDVKDTLLMTTMPDSIVCTGDPVKLWEVADGQYSFRWKDLNTNTIISNDPVTTVTPAAPRQNYSITVSLGKCFTDDTVRLKVVDPPKAAALPDTTICSGSKVLLRAQGGAFYSWTPAYYVDNPTQAVSWAHPKDTTTFTVTVTDTLGCPKAVSAAAKVDVVPPVRAFAGNDTIVMLNKPFQLNATGGVRYAWTPVDGLNNPDIFNPVTTINRDFTYTVTAYTQEGCSGTASIFVRFIIGPDIYIPNAFSPNGDGKNDIFRPLPVGIVHMDFFRVYDRWGKLMYSSTEYLKGWDGTVNGQPANIGTYVWVVQGKDINNNTVQRKGTVTLVR
ncbi:PKD domain-containing protein [Chitinophaga vietnamensis]|uniref:PKD domain-containing protein n=1 Tax=Chitinophaga vietnamensis TaxID=2593957 RepID=UPI001178320B|nr:PKD domain-containing protein [Chitinophaga vietnamensis]